MARKLLTDECGRRALGIVRVASTVPPAAGQRVGRDVGATHEVGAARDSGAARDVGVAQDVGAAHVEAPAWAVSWSRVTVTR